MSGRFAAMTVEAKDKADGTFGPVAVTARSVLHGIVFFFAGPPIGCLVITLMTFGSMVIDRKTWPRGVDFPGLVMMVLGAMPIGYLVGGLPALLTGAVVGLVACFNKRLWLLCLIGMLLGGASSFGLTRIFIDTSALLQIAGMLLIPGTISGLACVVITRRLRLGANSRI